MANGGWIRRARRYRLAIGLIAAYALLLGSLLPVFAAAADPLQAYLADHLCRPGEAAKGDSSPAGPAEPHKCQLCGPACPMAGHASAGAPGEDARPLPPRRASSRIAFRAESPDRPRLALYPSDSLSQAPPRAA